MPQGSHFCNVYENKINLKSFFKKITPSKISTQNFVRTKGSISLEEVLVQEREHVFSATVPSQNAI